MKKLVISLFLCLFFCFSMGQTIPETIDELLKVYTRQYAFNGTALVSQHGKVIFEKGYGFRNAEKHLPNDTSTIYQIGSITKQFTSAIILRLCDNHLLSLQDKLSKFIPDYPRGDEITIENLLSHTSGIWNYTNDEVFMKQKSIKPISRESLIALFKNKPLDFDPGKKYNYSNSGYILLGYIIEKITGKSYFDVVRQNIFIPLHMDHSGFDFIGTKSGKKAIGYNKLGASFSEPAMIVDSTVSFAAGSIYSTASDLYKWDRALYNGFLPDSSLKQAFATRLDHYALGWVIDTAYGKRVVMHEGGIFGFVSFIGRILDDQSCIILFDNHSATGLAKVAENINAILNDQPYEFPRYRKEMSLDSNMLHQYEGEYQFAPDFFITIRSSDGHLMVQAKGQGQNEFFAASPDFFFTKILEMQLEFIRDGNGKITRVNLYQGGQQIQGKKIK